jgi:peroxiredoxin
MSKVERILLYVGLAAATFLIFRVTSDYRTLADTHTELRQRLQWPHAGYSVPTFTGETIDGGSITLGEREDGRQFVFFFSTTCEFCLASLPAWKQITETSRTHEDLEVVAVAVDRDGAIRQYRDRHGLTFPITTFPSDKLARLYRAGNVPLIALLNSSGRVLYSRVGVLDEGAALDSVLTALRELPVAEDPIADPSSGPTAASG